MCWIDQLIEHVFSITWFGDAIVPNFFFTKEVAVLLQSLSLATMETKLYNIFKSLEESVEQIKRSGLNDVDATNNVIQHAQNLLANIKVNINIILVVFFTINRGCK